MWVLLLPDGAVRGHASGLVGEVARAARYERALAHGVRVLQPPIDREYGERECTLEDLAGHRWEFTETIRDVAPEEYGCETVSPWPE